MHGGDEFKALKEPSSTRGLQIPVRRIVDGTFPCIRLFRVFWVQSRFFARVEGLSPAASKKNGYMPKASSGYFLRGPASETFEQSKQVHSRKEQSWEVELVRIAFTLCCSYAESPGKRDQIVYVCACLKTKSCACVTED